MRSKGLLAGALLAALAHAAPAAATEERWVVVYSAKPPIAAFDDFKLVVLDGTYHPPLKPLLEQRKTVIGYLSLGEIEKHRDYYKDVEREGILLGTNPNWPESRFVDVRDPRWTKRVVEDLVPRLLQKGFQGIFIDTLDDPPDLERRDPVRFKGMTDAAAKLVQAIRRHYPRMFIMMNRAYEILPVVDGMIDAALGESVFTEIDFAKKAYRLADPKIYRQQVEWLQAAKKRRPGLSVFTLDYWKPDDKAGIARIYAEQRKNGFSPYVSIKELDRIVREPRR
ncbi:MAG: endo alpha-1,4 polygalactosaminidase [Rhodospirillaceae bacterium]|nr:endo alpha-1,4 polygalactosaminidase [Rhodospirillaceae bacterium]